MRVFAISDLHTDYSENLELVERFVNSSNIDKHRDDLIVIAGDVSEDLCRLIYTLRQFKRIFKDVFFIPGNHDLWMTKNRRNEENKFDCADQIRTNFADSIDKYTYILEVCDELSIRTQPYTYTSSELTQTNATTNSEISWNSLHIVPVQSWYHPQFDNEPDLPDSINGVKVPPTSRVISDNFQCTWPDCLENSKVDASKIGSLIKESKCKTNVANQNQKLNNDRVSSGIVEYSDNLAFLFDQFNIYSSPNFNWNLRDKSYKSKKDWVISFSHFLPRIELCPEKRHLFYPNLPKAIGSEYLRQRIRTLRPDIHVFGHTHFGWDMEIEDVRYIQAPLSYPRERKTRLSSLTIGDSPFSPLLIWDNGQQPSTYQTLWGDHYKQSERDPSILKLSPWVERVWKELAS